MKRARRRYSLKLRPPQALGFVRPPVRLASSASVAAMGAIGLGLGLVAWKLSSGYGLFGPSSKQAELWSAGRMSTGTIYEIAPGRFMAERAAQAYRLMEAAAKADGVTFQVNSAYRSNDEQVALYAKYQACQATPADARKEACVQTALPGHSNHQNGKAVDIESAGGTNAAFKWLTMNAARFGFARTVPSETWHWEYISA